MDQRPGVSADRSRGVFGVGVGAGRVGDLRGGGFDQRAVDAGGDDDGGKYSGGVRGVWVGVARQRVF